MRILLVEDDDKIGSFVEKGLRQESYAVDRVADGELGLTMAANGRYDAAIIDVMLPGRDGLSVIRELRRRGVQTPVLILSAKDAVNERVAGLQAGADDYLTKPFSFVELVARVQALLRRASHVGEASVLRYNGLSLELSSRKVRRGDQEIELAAKEFALLELLLRNPERVLSKTMILEHVWDFAFDPQTNVVDVLVHRLRSKVDRDFDVQLIQTVRGVGYVLREQAAR